jgi:hypothetical protein
VVGGGASAATATGGRRVMNGVRGDGLSGYAMEPEDRPEGAVARRRRRGWRNVSVRGKRGAIGVLFSIISSSCIDDM